MTFGLQTASTRSSAANIAGPDSPSRTPVSVSCFGRSAGIKQVVLMLWWIVINGQNKKWLVFGWRKEHKSKLSNVACLVTKAEDESLDFRAAVNANRSRSSIFSHQLGAGGYLCLSAVTAEGQQTRERSRLMENPLDLRIAVIFPVIRSTWKQGCSYQKLLQSVSAHQCKPPAPPALKLMREVSFPVSLHKQKQAFSWRKVSFRAKKVRIYEES